MLLDEINDHLVANVAGVSGSDLFRSLLPATPDDAVALFEYPGEPTMHVKGRHGPVHELPRFQVLVRSKGYAAAREKAERVHRLLDGFSGELSGVGYGRITALQSPFFLSRDDSGRPRIVCNYRVIKEPSPLSMPP